MTDPKSAPALPESTEEFIRRAKKDAREALDALYLLAIESGVDRNRASGLAHHLAGAVGRLSDCADRASATAELQAQVEALRKDAERFRWIDKCALTAMQPLQEGPG
jgi:non-canonical (house-cleaning) NTP pyrophosphatase